MDLSVSKNLRATVAAAELECLDQRVKRLDADLDGAVVSVAWQEFEALHRDIASCVGAIKDQLLALGVEWSTDDKSRAAWIYSLHRDFAALGSRVAELLVRKLGARDARSLGAIATALYYEGESVKSEIAVPVPAPRAYAEMHSLMRMAMLSGYLRRRIKVNTGGRQVACTLESLYFRALLLARFTSGSLSCRQAEILDAWMFMWSPSLRGAAHRPDDASLCVDLDSHHGLQRGSEALTKGSLYLLQQPIAKAYQEILAQLQSGRIVPADGCTAGFRVEEHIAVLDLIRRGLRQSVDQAVRAERTSVNADVQVLVGLAEITAGAYALHAPLAASVDLVAPGPLSSRTKPRDALDSIYEVRVRMARLVNESATGFCLEGSSESCGGISAGDLVALRGGPLQAVQLGKVARSVASATPGNTIVGVRRISSTGCRALARDPSASPGAPGLPMIFVAGEDATGRYDGYLVSEREYEKCSNLEAEMGDDVFAFRFNRVRERGRGWILAGFEIDGVRKHAGARPAA
jgi:hypothetical protein